MLEGATSRPMFHASSLESLNDRLSNLFHTAFWYSVWRAYTGRTEKRSELKVMLGLKGRGITHNSPGM